MFARKKKRKVGREEYIELPLHSTLRYSLLDDEQIKWIEVKNISGMKFVKCNFSGMDLSYVNCSDAHFDRCLFDNTNFSFANLHGSQFLTCSINQSNFYKAKMNKNTFIFNTDLENSNLFLCNVEQDNFRASTVKDPYSPFLATFFYHPSDNEMNTYMLSDAARKYSQSMSYTLCVISLLERDKNAVLLCADVWQIIRNYYLQVVGQESPKKIACYINKLNQEKAGVLDVNESVHENKRSRNCGIM